MTSSNLAGGDDFVNIWFAAEDDDSNPIGEAQKKHNDFYSQWVDQCMLQSTFPFYSISKSIVASARHSSPPILG